MPSEQEVGASFHVSRLTARRAFSELVQEGLLRRRSGLGTFVVGRKFIRDPSAITGLWDTIRELGMKPTARVVSKEVCQADPEVSEALEVPLGDPLYRICRIRLADAKPIAYHIAYVPADYFPGLLAKDLVHQSLYHLYREYGFAPASGEQRIEAIIAKADLATHLGVPAGSAVLHLRRITRASNGRIVEFVLCYNRCDRYGISMPLHF